MLRVLRLLASRWALPIYTVAGALAFVVYDPPETWQAGDRAPAQVPFQVLVERYAGRQFEHELRPMPAADVRPDFSPWTLRISVPEGRTVAGGHPLLWTVLEQQACCQTIELKISNKHHWLQLRYAIDGDDQVAPLSAEYVRRDRQALFALGSGLLLACILWLVFKRWIRRLQRGANPPA